MPKLCSVLLFASLLWLPQPAGLQAGQTLLEPITSGTKIRYEAGLQTPDKVIHPFSQYQGQVLVVNFWATWCPHCRAELSALNQLQAQLKGQPVRVLRVTTEDPDVVKRWLKDNRVDFPIYIGTLSPVELPVNGFPTTYVIGKDGEVRYKHVGRGAWDDPAVAEALIALAR